VYTPNSGLLLSNSAPPCVLASQCAIDAALHTVRHDNIMPLSTKASVAYQVMLKQPSHFTIHSSAQRSQKC
jgi:hypothetical protein